MMYQEKEPIEGIVLAILTVISYVIINKQSPNKKGNKRPKMMLIVAGLFLLTLLKFLK